MEEKNQFLLWVKEHKKQLLKVGVPVTTIVVWIILGAKNQSIEKLWASLKDAIEKTSVIKPSVNTKIAAAGASPDATKAIASIKIPSKILDNLTGKRLTATNLGQKVGLSPQAINKRLVSKGLVEKLVNGDYSLTESGKLIGENTIKTTRYDHTFSNFEWDEKVLELIFSPKELREIAEKQLHIKEILKSFVAR